tara:strand:- start:333 stop:1076 length:744 start_codon:yes stop_codon:yes gene_type:complete
MAIRSPHYHSITELNETEAFELQVARGLVGGHTSVNIFGYQPLVATDAVCIWEYPIPYVYPSAPVQMSLVSDSASDTSQVLVLGLTTDFAPYTETVTLNGINPALTAGLFLRINDMIFLNGVATNIGTIAATNGGTTYAAISPNIGKSQMSQYTVAAGHTFYLNRVNSYAQQNGGVNNYNTYSVDAKTQESDYIVLQSPYFQSYEAMRVVPFRYAEKTSVQWRSRTQTNTSAVGMVIEGILIKDDIG